MFSILLYHVEGLMCSLFYVRIIKFAWWLISCYLTRPLGLMVTSAFFYKKSFPIIQDEFNHLLWWLHCKAMWCSWIMNCKTDYDSTFPSSPHKHDYGSRVIKIWVNYMWEDTCRFYRTWLQWYLKDSKASNLDLSFTSSWWGTVFSHIHQILVTIKDKDVLPY